MDIVHMSKHQMTTEKIPNGHCVPHNVRINDVVVRFTTVLIVHKIHDIHVIIRERLHYYLDRSITHAKFDPTGIRTHDLQVITVHFMSLRCPF